MPAQWLADAVAAELVALGASVAEGFALERPRHPEHGDWAVNCFPLAKGTDRSGAELAAATAAALLERPPRHLATAEAVGGFLNLRLDPAWLHDVLVDVVEQGVDRYAHPDLGHGLTVNLEYISANPTGPLHAGHGRWAAYGDSLARLLTRTGHVVEREFYVNDRGVQMQLFGASLAAVKAGHPLPEGGYRGQYIEEWASEMPDGADPVEWGLQRALADQRETLGAMRVGIDHWASERELVAAGALEATLADLQASGEVYQSHGATWLRTSDHGDDKDRVLVKSDGHPTYFLPDIAYHRDKLGRAERLIDVLGADHHGYVKRMHAAVDVLGHEPSELEIIIGQNVTLLRGGEEVRLSKRQGTMIELKADVLDEVGADAARFAYLQQSIDTKLLFDVDVLVQQSMDNPVYYAQMAHARLCGIRRTAADKGVEAGPLAGADLSLLRHPRERDILLALNDLPDVVADAARRRAPHRVTAWVRELSTAVHGFHHDCWVVSDDVPLELARARLWLVEAARVGMVIGLDLLGVTAPERL